MMRLELLLISTILLASLLARPAPADDIRPFYQAYAIVTGTDMRQRPWGFAQCLREVLVKVSGDPRLKDDSRTNDVAAHADQYVASFDYVDMMAGIPRKDDQGSYDRPHRLTVYFDPVRINQALAQLGDTPWRGKRPTVVPVLLVRGRKPPAYVLSASLPVGAEQRGAFATAAGEFGMTVRFPTEAELARWAIAVDHFPSATAPLPSQPADQAIVVGTLEWSETLPGWIGAYRTRWRGVAYNWGISGVNYDAAFRDLVRGVVLIASRHGAPDARLNAAARPSR
jgi:uncharacterized protein